jgi:hypothetical protein
MHLSNITQTQATGANLHDGNHEVADRVTFGDTLPNFNFSNITEIIFGTDSRHHADTPDLILRDWVVWF